MTFGVLVTNYNTWSLTSQCIQNCLEFSDDSLDAFVVVDDKSSEDFENNFGDTITLIKNEENLGLAKSLNRGLENINTDLVCIFDSDAWPLENFILKTKEYFKENPKIGIAVFSTERKNGEKAPSFEPEPDIMSLLLGQYLNSTYTKIFRNKDKDITLYTCAMVIRRAVISDVVGFDESYDWLDLDHDICMAAKEKKWQMGIIPIRAYHKGSGTPQKVSKRVIRSYQNRVKLLKKFNKYPFEDLINFLILFRLTVEYVLIWSVGRWRYGRDTYVDKLFSRQFLLNFFLKSYYKND